MIYKLFGIFGLALITAGILLKKKKKGDIAFIVGGISLLVYSISLKDMIFVSLQVVFTLAAVYDYFKLK